MKSVTLIGGADHGSSRHRMPEYPRERSFDALLASSQFAQDDNLKVVDDEIRDVDRRG